MNEIKASRLETLGAWLGLWTPPRDVVVPPIPWRKVAIGAAGLAVVVAAFAAFGAPAIDDAKDEGAAQRQRELDERAAARRARIERLQQPRFGDIPDGASRASVITTIETEIGADARERFSPRSRTATCEPSPGVDAAAKRVAYDCLTVTSDIVGAADQEGAQGQLGYPYRAVIDDGAGRYAYCRIFPLPGEQALADPRTQIRVPDACSMGG